MNSIQACNATLLHTKLPKKACYIVFRLIDLTVIKHANEHRADCDMKNTGITFTDVNTYSKKALNWLFEHDYIRYGNDKAIYLHPILTDFPQARMGGDDYPMISYSNQWLDLPEHPSVIRDIDLPEYCDAYDKPTTNPEV